MFDFGSKEIEDLKRVIAKLTFENMEKDKTVDSLIEEVNKLNDKIKELEKEIEYLNNEIEIEKTGIKTSHIEISQSDIDNDNTKVQCYKAIDYTYIETKQSMLKKYKNTKLTYFIDKETKKIIQPDEINNSHYDKIIRMYSGIPYRTFQDLCFINDFLESNKYKYYRDECNTEQILSHVTRELVGNKLIYKIYGRKINDFVRKFEEVRNTKYWHENIRIYKQRTLPMFYTYIFEDEKEFMKAAKQLIYNKVELVYNIKNWNC